MIFPTAYCLSHLVYLVRHTYDERNGRNVTRSENKILTSEFENRREQLRTLAHRILGSLSEAEDVVQEAWLRLSKADWQKVENPGAWLTTVVGRLCLDLLRTRKTRREEPIGPEAEALPSAFDVEQNAIFVDDIGTAMTTVVDNLPPPERVAFILHDMFNVPFERIAPILARSPVAARQLASRGRRRVRGQSPSPEEDRHRQQEIVAAFLRASRGGDFSTLLALLDPDIVLRADAAAVAASLAYDPTSGLAPEIRGHEGVANIFIGRAQGAQAAMVDGAPGLVVAPRGWPLGVFEFVIEADLILEIILTSDPLVMGALELDY